MIGQLILSAQPKNCTLTPSSREKIRIKIEEDTKQFLLKGKEIKEIPPNTISAIKNQRNLLT